MWYPTQRAASVSQPSAPAGSPVQQPPVAPPGSPTSWRRGLVALGVWAGVVSVALLLALVLGPGGRHLGSTNGGAFTPNPFPRFTPFPINTPYPSSTPFPSSPPPTATPGESPSGSTHTISVVFILKDTCAHARAALIVRTVDVTDGQNVLGTSLLPADGLDSLGPTCTFSSTVSDVTDSPKYVVTVALHHQATLTEAQMAASNWKVTITA